VSEVDKCSADPLVVALYHTAVFCNVFLLTAHPTLTMACEGTPQNFALRKMDTKEYMATKMKIYM
jgi:hypothetical protein